MFFPIQVFLSISKRQFSFIILNTLITNNVAIFCFHLLCNLKYFFLTIASVDDITSSAIFFAAYTALLKPYLLSKAPYNHLPLFPWLLLSLYCLVHILVPPSCYFVPRRSFSPSTDFVSYT